MYLFYISSKGIKQTCRAVFVVSINQKKHCYEIA